MNKIKSLISSALGHEPSLKFNVADNRVLSHVVTTVTPHPMMTNVQPVSAPASLNAFTDPGATDTGGDALDAACDSIDPGDPFDNPGDPTDSADPSDPFSDPGSDSFGDFGGGGDPGGGRDYFGFEEEGFV